MATDVIIKFYSGTAQQVDFMTQNKATCIGFQTDTGKLFWKVGGNKFLLKVNWSDVLNKPPVLTSSDSATPAFIQTLLNTFLPSYSIVNLEREDQAIDTSKIVYAGSGAQITATYPTGLKANPTWLMTNTGHLYSIEPDSVTIQQSGAISIELSRYLSYENLTSVPSGWKLCYR